MIGSVMTRAAVVVGLGIAATAQANTIPVGTYSLNGVTVDGFQLTGSVMLNASGMVSAASITLNDPALGNPVFTQIDSTGAAPGNSQQGNYADVSDPGVGELVLYYMTGVDSNGDVDLCIQSTKNCNGNGHNISSLQMYENASFGDGAVSLTGGTLDEQATTQSGAMASPPANGSAVTPEPGSLALLGTGVLGLAGLVRRKQAACLS